MEFHLRFSCRTRAFNANARAETARVLREMARAIETSKEDELPAFDADCNRIGRGGFALSTRQDLWRS